MYSLSAMCFAYNEDQKDNPQDGLLSWVSGYDEMEVDRPASIFKVDAIAIKALK